MVLIKLYYTDILLHLTLILYYRHSRTYHLSRVVINFLTFKFAPIQYHLFLLL